MTPFTKSTIRELRPVVFTTHAQAACPLQALKDVQRLHREKIEHYSAQQSLNVGPVMFAGTGTDMHPFANVLIAIACGAEIEMYLPSDIDMWVPIEHGKVLACIGANGGRYTPSDFRVKP